MLVKTFLYVGENTNKQFHRYSSTYRLFAKKHISPTLKHIGSKRDFGDEHSRGVKSELSVSF